MSAHDGRGTRILRGSESSAEPERTWRIDMAAAAPDRKSSGDGAVAPGRAATRGEGARMGPHQPRGGRFRANAESERTRARPRERPHPRTWTNSAPLLGQPREQLRGAA